MDWEQLLCEVRVRELLGGKPSQRYPDDRRTEFDRDYDRSIFSTRVKRLQDKAQVFPLEPNDSVRTRLTHSLEVASVAKGLASDVGQWLASRGYLGRKPERPLRAIETVAMTAGLIHDIGNPPFGHSGERAIRDWFKSRPKEFLSFAGRGDRKQLANDFLIFEGNAQTLRLACRLQVLADEYGLNLTAGTISAACKYTVPSHKTNGDSANHAHRKPGFFASESAVVEAVRKATGTKGARNPITFLVEAADDAVYATVDLEDGVRKGVLHWKTMDKWLKDAASTDPSGLIVKSLEGAERQINEAIANNFVRGRSEDEALVQAFRVSAIYNIVKAAAETFIEHYDQIMAGRFTADLVSKSKAAALVDVCKRLGQQFVYCSDETLRLEVQGRTVIHGLMEMFWEGAEHGSEGGRKFPDKIYALLSRNYKTVCNATIERKVLPEKYCKLQLVTDYVCGMTDSFACNLHRRLKNS